MANGCAQRLQLYPAQAAGVERYCQSPGGRMLLAYGTGCGKTPTAIRAIVERDEMLAYLARELRPALRILVVCPAMVRRHWCREFQRWAGLEALPIEMGRHRTSGTKEAKRLRDAAYAARIQVVSYDLVGEVDADSWDYIVLDEVHHLSHPTSKQSKMIHSLLAANQRAGCLGLSATLIPTDVRQIWHPLMLLFGARKWGKPNRRGGLSWEFADEYCGIERNDYGCAPGKGREEALPKLREEVEKVAHRLTRRDILPDLPPLNVRMLDIPGQRTDLVQAAADWGAQLGSDVRKIVILTYHRSLAKAIVQPFGSGDQDAEIVRDIDGSMPTAQRDAILRECEESASCVLVATSESLREGIRMMWAEHVLLLEWRQSPAQVLQILGRFQSVGDPRKPQLDILTDESMATEAAKLLDRIAVVNKVIAAGDAEHKVAELFQPRELTEDRLTTLTLELFADVEKTEQRDAFAEEFADADD